MLPYKLRRVLGGHRVQTGQKGILDSSTILQPQCPPPPPVPQLPQAHRRGQSQISPSLAGTGRTRWGWLESPVRRRKHLKTETWGWGSQQDENCCLLGHIGLLPPLRRLSIRDQTTPHYEVPKNVLLCILFFRLINLTLPEEDPTWRMNFRKNLYFSTCPRGIKCIRGLYWINSSKSGGTKPQPSLFTTISPPLLIFPSPPKSQGASWHRFQGLHDMDSSAKLERAAKSEKCKDESALVQEAWHTGPFRPWGQRPPWTCFQSFSAHRSKWKYHIHPTNPQTIPPNQGQRKIYR